MKANPPKKEKVRHIYSLMCETLIFAEDKRLSMINVIANVRLPKVPAGMGALGFVCTFQAPVGDVFSVSVEDPKRIVLLKTPDAAVEAPGVGLDAPQIIKSTQVGLIAGPIIFQSEGIYHIVLRVGGRVVHREPFAVFVDPALTGGQTNDTGDKAVVGPSSPGRGPISGGLDTRQIGGSPDNRRKRSRRAH